MQISELKLTKKYITIKFTDEDELKLSKEILGEFYLYIGKELTDTELNEIKLYDAMEKHYRYCLNVIARKNYTVKEIIDKLKKRKVDYLIIDQIIVRLKAHNYLNDQRYAIEKGNFLIKTKKMSKNAVARFFKTRGLNEFLIEDTLSKLIDNEVELLTQLMPRVINKYKNRSLLEAEMKIKQHLLTKGFKTDDINQVLNMFTLSDFVDEVVNLERELERYIDESNLNNEKERQLVYNKLVKKGYPTRLIKQKLKEKLKDED